METSAQGTPSQPQPVSGRRSWSLRREFGRLLLLVGVVPALLIGTVLLWSQANQERIQLGERIGIAARLTATSIDDSLQGHLAGLGLLASMTPPEAESSEWSARLRRAARLYPAFLTMLVTDDKGSIQAVFPRQRMRDAIGMSVADRTYFQVPRDTGLGYISDAFTGRGMGADPLVAVSAPLLRDGRFAGIVEGSIRITSFSEFQGAAMHSRGYELALLDRRLRVIYASPGLDYRFLQQLPSLPPGAADTAQRTEAGLRSGGAALVAEGPMRNGWTVRVLVPEGDLNASLQRKALLMMGLMILLVGGVLAASFRQMHLLARAVNALVQRMRQVAFDDEVQWVDVSTVPGEMAPLAEALNHSSSQLSDAYRDMSRSLNEQRRLRQLLEQEVGTREHEISERTRELRAAVSELDRLSRTDALTGCLNRRGLDEAMQVMRERSRETSEPVAVLALDIDHFKDYNDRYGHPAGDAALRRFVGAMRSALYGGDDLIARIGGEEFLVLLPGGDLQVARSAAERIRKAVRDAGIPHAGEEQGVLAVSIGVAISSAQARDGMGTAVEQADEALYRAKREGRNRVAE